VTTADVTTDEGPAVRPDLWSAERRRLTVGLVLTITLVAFESLAIATIMPEVKDDLGGLGLYGWVFSGFFLSSLLGIVLAGRMADHRGLALPFTLGLGMFAGGLVVGGAATSMEMLVAGRVAQGFGAGAIPAVAYAAIGRGYLARERPRMFATLSTAWIVPGLVGPGVATLVEHTWSWRWVFLGLLPIVLAAGAMAVPALTSLGPPGDGAPVEAPEDRRGILLAVALVGGLAAVFGAGAGAPMVLAGALVLAGLPVAVWAFVGLVPRGTLRLAPGVPAAVAVRGILTWGFFAADAYIPLAVVDGRDGPTWMGGAALSVACFTWAGASWVQARIIDRVGPRRLALFGFVLIVAGEALLLAMVRGLPPWVCIPAWAIGAAGIGTVYAPLSVTVLGAAAPGEEGAASASIQLTDALGIAVGTAVSGWIVAVGDDGDHTVASSTTVVFVLAIVVSAFGILASTRLPRTVPTAGDRH
jgi:MFS family permease